MKKIFLFLFTATLLFGSCDEQLDRDWNNPNVYVPKPEEVVSGLFTHMQKTRFWMQDYGEWYWYLSGWDQSWVEIAQITLYLPYSDSYLNFFADDFYGNVENFVSTANNNIYQRFERFYTELTNYGLIRDEVNALSESEAVDAAIYAKLATVLKDIVALQTVDLFNKIPYFNAFRGSEGVFFTPYDDPLEIYKSVIEEYQTIAGELPGIYNKMSALGKKTLATQDLFFKGDVDKWVKYINAETLKACVRISGVAADYVKPVLAKAITNLPAEDYTFASPQVNENRIGNSAGGIVQRGLYEQYYNVCIPDVIMTRLNRGEDLYEKELDDPRLPVLGLGYAPTGNADSVEYFGISGNMERNRFLRIAPPDTVVNPHPLKGSRNRNTYIRPTASMDAMVKTSPWTNYNPITFVLNETPLYVFSLAEIDLLLAEVSLKNLASTEKTAGAYINAALKHSTDFWYFVNSQPHYAGTLTDLAQKVLQPQKPDATIINNYAATLQSEFEAASGTEDKMEIIMQQKYIHLNIMQPFECFAELRRTRHPKLEPITCTGIYNTIVNATMMLERWKLPPSEKTNNPDEYEKVMAEDLWGNPVFWVPSDKINEKYFLPTAIKAPLP